MAGENDNTQTDFCFEHVDGQLLAHGKKCGRGRQLLLACSRVNMEEL